MNAKHLSFPPQGTRSWLELVEAQVGSVQFGVIQIVVHEGRVVQIERTEKFRFGKGDKSSAPIATTAAREEQDEN